MTARQLFQRFGPLPGRGYIAPSAAHKMLHSCFLWTVELLFYERTSPRPENQFAPVDVALARQIAKDAFDHYAQRVTQPMRSLLRETHTYFMHTLDVLERDLASAPSS